MHNLNVDQGMLHSKQHLSIQWVSHARFLRVKKTVVYDFRTMKLFPGDSYRWVWCDSCLGWAFYLFLGTVREFHKGFRDAWNSEQTCQVSQWDWERGKKLHPLPHVRGFIAFPWFFFSACQFFTPLTGFLPLSILYTAFKFAGKRITGKRTCRASSSDAELNLDQKRRFGTREIQLNSPFGENFLPRMFQHRLAHLLCYVHWASGRDWRRVGKDVIICAGTVLSTRLLHLEEGNSRQQVSEKNSFCTGQFEIVLCTPNLINAGYAISLPDKGENLR